MLTLANLPPNLRNSLISKMGTYQAAERLIDDLAALSYEDVQFIRRMLRAMLRLQRRGNKVLPRLAPVALRQYRARTVIVTQRKAA